MESTSPKSEAREFVDDLWALVDKAQSDGDFMRARELQRDAREAELQLATQFIPAH